MTSSEKLLSIIHQFNNIGGFDIFKKAKTIRDSFALIEINNCIAHIEILNLSGTGDDVKYALQKAGFVVKKIGLDIYVCKKMKQAGISGIAEKTEEYKLATKVKDILKSRGIDMPFSVSDTDFGVSIYFTVYDNNLQQKLKIRISDHGVSNVNRIFNEQHENSRSDPERIANDIELAMYPDHFKQIQTGVMYYSKFNNNWITEPVVDGKAWVKSYNNEATEKLIDGLNPKKTRVVSKEFVRQSKTGNNIYKVVLENLTEVGEVPVYKYERKNETIPFEDGSLQSKSNSQSEIAIDSEDNIKKHNSNKSDKIIISRLIAKPYPQPENHTFVIEGIGRIPAPKDNFEAELAKLKAENTLRTIKLSYVDEITSPGINTQVRSSKTIAELVRLLLGDQIEVREHFIAFFLNRKNKVTGYYLASIGGPTATIVDIKMINAAAVRSIAQAVIISHNHPSNDAFPSDPDKDLTKKLKNGLRILETPLLDHVIVTKDHYYSFADEGESSLDGANTIVTEDFESGIITVRNPDKENIPWLHKKGFMFYNDAFKCKTCKGLKDEVTAKVILGIDKPNKSIDELQREYESKTFDELIKIKKQLYPNPDIESAMSAEEKLLKRIMADKASERNQAVIERRKEKKAAENPIEQFVEKVRTNLEAHQPQNKRTIESLARQYDITDQNDVKEYTELAIVQIARKLALEAGKTIRQRFDAIVSLYKNQVNLSHRTSRSILLQQYSTPAPIGYMMGVYVGSGTALQSQLGSVKRGGRFTKNHFSVPKVQVQRHSAPLAPSPPLPSPPLFFEPSAGNGLLTIAMPPEYWDVNEIDETRRHNLETQGYNQVTAFNAADKLIYDVDPRTYDGVITNPPFGQLDEPVKMGGFLLDELDHIMAAYALENMKDTGRAAIIVGGHISYEPASGRIKQQGEKGGNRNFYNYLYRNYDVDDIIYINGDLYSRQGTSFDVRVILIAGRKPKPEGFAPKQTPEMNKVVDNWDEFYTRVMSNITTTGSKVVVNKDTDAILPSREWMDEKFIPNIPIEVTKTPGYQKAFERFSKGEISRDELISVANWIENNPESKIANLQPEITKPVWQMTQVEIGNKKTEKIFPYNGKVDIVDGKPLYTASTTIKWDDGVKTFEVSGRSQPSLEKLHKKIIEQALAEGKPVPEEVLKDYPELKSTTQNLMVYAKFKGDTKYAAMNIKKGTQVGNLLFASLIPDNKYDELVTFLKEAYTLNPDIQFKIVVAGKEKVLFTTEDLPNPQTDIDLLALEFEALELELKLLEIN